MSSFFPKRLLGVVPRQAFWFGSAEFSGSGPGVVVACRPVAFIWGNPSRYAVRVRPTKIDETECVGQASHSEADRFDTTTAALSRLLKSFAVEPKEGYCLGRGSDRVFHLIFRSVSNYVSGADRLPAVYDGY